MIPQSFNKINPFVTEKNKQEVKLLIDMISSTHEPSLFSVFIQSIKKNYF
jgi:hypothetical protein